MRPELACLAPLQPIDTIEATFELVDERFAVCRGDERVERLWSRGRPLERPVYIPSGRYLLFSDIPLRDHRRLRGPSRVYERVLQQRR